MSRQPVGCTTVLPRERFISITLFLFLLTYRIILRRLIPSLLIMSGNVLAGHTLRSGGEAEELQMRSLRERPTKTLVPLLLEAIQARSNAPPQCWPTPTGDATCPCIRGSCSHSLFAADRPFQPVSHSLPCCTLCTYTTCVSTLPDRVCHKFSNHPDCRSLLTSQTPSGLASIPLQPITGPPVVNSLLRHHFSFSRSLFPNRHNFLRRDRMCRINLRRPPPPRSCKPPRPLVHTCTL